MKAIRKTVSVYVVKPNGDEVKNELWACHPQKAREVFNRVQRFVDKPNADGKIEKTYCCPMETLGYGWANLMKPILIDFFEASACYHPSNESTPEEIIDAIACDDDSLTQFFFGSGDGKFAGFLQLCREATVRFI